MTPFLTPRASEHKPLALYSPAVPTEAKNNVGGGYYSGPPLIQADLTPAHTRVY